MFSAQAYSGHLATNGVNGRRHVTVADHGVVKTPSSSTVNIKRLRPTALYLVKSIRHGTDDLKLANNPQ
jgi:hypothetical protein